MTRMIPALVGATLLTTVAAAQTPAPAVTPTPVVATPVEAAADTVNATGSTPVAPGVALPAHGYTYNAENRRDPFVPLLKGNGKEITTTTAVARAAGLAGLGASEVTLRGVLASQGGYVAMLLGTDEKTYIVRPGDKLADGTIRAITSEMMVIQQRYTDSLSRPKEREVRKTLRQIDGTH